jgi:integrase/recombinase XerD
MAGSRHENRGSSFVSGHRLWKALHFQCFGNKFRAWCNEAGLYHCTVHELRKACAARLAERGASAHEIMSITGHKSLEEVERYTRAARQKIMADEAMEKF